MHEHIRHAVPIVRHQVGGRGRKRDDVPSALIDGFMLGPSLSAPDDEMLTRQVRRPTRSRTKTSLTPFRSPANERRRSRREGNETAARAQHRPERLPIGFAASRAQVRATHAENDVFTENVCADWLGLRLSEEHDGRGSAESVCDPCSPPPPAQGLHGANPVSRGRRQILTASPVRPHDRRPVTR